MIGRRRLVTSELRHQIAGQNDNNEKRQMMRDEVKMSWLNDITDRNGIDVEIIPLKHVAGTCVRACSAVLAYGVHTGCIQCIQGAYSAYGVHTGCIQGAYSAYGVHTGCIQGAYSAYGVHTGCIQNAYTGVT